METSIRPAADHETVIMIVFWWRFGFGKRCGVSSASNSEDTQKKGRRHLKTTTFLFNVLFMRHPFIELFWPPFLLHIATINWSTLSSLATSRVILRGSASIMATSSSLSISDGRPSSSSLSHHHCGIFWIIIVPYVH